MLNNKPYISLFQFPIKRSKWNPLRYIFGEYTTTKNAKKAWEQLEFDVNDIEIIPHNPKNDLHAYLIKKYLKVYCSKNTQLFKNIKKNMDKHYETNQTSIKDRSYGK